MRLKGLITAIWVIILVTLFPSIFTVVSQEPTPNLTPIEPTYLAVFPGDLFCYEVGSTQNGPTWNGITVGLSTISDLEQYLQTLSNYYVSWNDDLEMMQVFLLDWDAVDPYQQRIPNAVTACVDNEIITVLQVNSPLSPYMGQIYISDLIALYGVPDDVTYTTNPPFIVVAFWFEAGIAAEIYTASNERFEPNEDDPLYGRVTDIIYFPFQDTINYEAEYPYNRTRSFNPYLPAPVGTENPFDMEAIAATVTLQPSRTVTPTLTPHPTNTGIPTPTITLTLRSP